jgi:hypothetical protein
MKDVRTLAYSDELSKIIAGIRQLDSLTTGQAENIAA